MTPAMHEIEYISSIEYTPSPLYAPRRWRGVVGNLLKKEDKADPGNYRGLTLLSTGGKTFL